MAPLYVKYRTRSGKYYLYDLGTGRILEVDAVVYAVIDDFRILTEDEILTTHENLDRENVEQALRELAEIRSQGYLADHNPSELARVGGIVYDRKLYSLDEFWRKTASLLILGITERCNLNCSYCSFTGGYSGRRTHSEKSMSFDTAKRAIVDYIANDPSEEGEYPITFYGGEPLLEFDLLRQIVDFAGNFAAELGKKINFAITTNGTLLDDEFVDYLVLHDFYTGRLFRPKRRAKNTFPVRKVPSRTAVRIETDSRRTGRSFGRKTCNSGSSPRARPCFPPSKRRYTTAASSG